jgi:hypothetical protein
VGLDAVLGDVRVDELNDVISDRGSEDSGHWNLTNNVGLALCVNAHNWTCSHLFFQN